ncbi:MAG: GIY-YIG nuclease family protein [Chitinophagaceae bacterium]|nr:GIY-YIG nuclease family protein [Chitinophagaceae bacterium]
MSRATIYTGVTSNLVKRIWEHRNGIYPDSFTPRYNVHILVYYEVYESIIVAIDREKEIKGWSRQKKKTLIENKNPHWAELMILRRMQ